VCGTSLPRAERGARQKGGRGAAIRRQTTSARLPLLRLKLASGLVNRIRARRPRVLWVHVSLQASRWRQPSPACFRSSQWKTPSPTRRRNPGRSMASLAPSTAKLMLCVTRWLLLARGALPASCRGGRLRADASSRNGRYRHEKVSNSTVVFKACGCRRARRQASPKAETRGGRQRHVAVLAAE
jgi:hypothetical protein